MTPLRLGGARARRVRWRGLDEFDKALSAMPAEVRREAQEDAMHSLAADAEAHMDLGLLDSQRTGRLRRGLRVVRVRAKGRHEVAFEIIAGTRTGNATGAEHGYVWRFVEYGVLPHAVGRSSDRERVRITSKGFKRRSAGKQIGAMHPGHPAKPFVRPAITKTRARSRQILAAALERAQRRALERAGAR